MVLSPGVRAEDSQEAHAGACPSQGSRAQDTLRQAWRAEQTVPCSLQTDSDSASP